MTRGRRGPARHAQHGRIRLRLHRRERPRRRLPQPARPGPDERRLVVGLRRGDGGGAGAGLARLGHQRLAAGAGLALRRLQPEADLRPAAADRDLSLRRQPRPPRPVRAHRARPRRSPTTRCRGRTPATTAVRAAPAGPGGAAARRAARRTARRRCSAAGSTRTPARRRGPRSPGSPRRWRRTPRSDTLRLDEAEAGRAAAYLITNAESADFHLDGCGRAPPTSIPTRATASSPERCCRPPGSRGRGGSGAGGWSGRSPPSAFRPAGGAGDALPGPGRGGEDAGAWPAATSRSDRASAFSRTPFSCIGLPVATVPLFGDQPMPVGVQLVARPWREHVCLQAAHLLEQAGAAIACPPVAWSHLTPDTGAHLRPLVGA